jgi:hypothetical protein
MAKFWSSISVFFFFIATTLLVREIIFQHFKLGSVVVKTELVDNFFHALVLIINRE